MTLINTWVPKGETFGARLALLRQEMGWNMKQAAVACGVSESTWRGWELEGRQPHNLPKVAESISQVTHVDDVWLMKGNHQLRDYIVEEAHHPHLTARTRTPSGPHMTRPPKGRGNTHPRSRK